MSILTLHNNKKYPKTNKSQINDKQKNKKKNKTTKKT